MTSFEEVPRLRALPFIHRLVHADFSFGVAAEVIFFGLLAL